MGRRRTYSTLGFEALGFALVAALVYANEYLDLPHRLFGAPVTPVRSVEVALEVGVIVLLGAGVMSTSWRTNQRIAHLETLLLICGGCRRLEVEGRWLAFEAYVEQRDHLQTSHGLCPTCYQQQIGELADGAPEPRRL